MNTVSIFVEEITKENVQLGTSDPDKFVVKNEIVSSSVDIHT